jgi:thiol:disulfide interchange protein DsbD
MERFREALAFPMYGAAAWLTWVFALQTHLDGLPMFMAAAVALAMAAWLFGRAQRSSKPRRWRGVALVATMAALTLTYFSTNSLNGPNVGPSAQRWTIDAQRRLLAMHAPVFVEFTAAWCVTCQVNDVTVLSRPAIRSAFRAERIAYLRADWTTPDDKIVTELNAHGRAGVPFYIMYGASGHAVALPQILSERTLLEAIHSAQSR